MTFAFVLRYSSTLPANSAELRDSTRNAFTARMPVMVSTNFTMSRAEAVRVARNRDCDRTWNHRVRIANGTREPTSTSPLIQSTAKSAMTVNPM